MSRSMTISYGKAHTTEQSTEKTPYSKSNTVEDENRLYLDVPFHEKNDAKKLGAKWDQDARKWYAPEPVSSQLVSTWGPGAPPRPKKRTVKLYLDVPFEDKDEAKLLGARWDRNAVKWYTQPNMNPILLRKWGTVADRKKYIKECKLIPPVSKPTLFQR